MHHCKQFNSYLVYTPTKKNKNNNNRWNKNKIAGKNNGKHQKYNVLKPTHSYVSCHHITTNSYWLIIMYTSFIMYTPHQIIMYIMYD